MVRKIVVGIVLGMIFVSLAACQTKGGITIEHGSVEFGSIQDRDDRNLHFRVSLVENENVSKTDYNIRFIVEDPYILELIGTDTVEVPDTYETTGNGGGLVTGTSMPLAKGIDHDKLRKVVEKGKAVTVEVYHHDEVFDRYKVDLFRENIRPVATFNSKAKIETIELTEANEIEQFKKALNGMIKKENLFDYRVIPDYQLKVGDESYYLWTDDAGKMMNVQDPYALYSLPTQSLYEILESIGEEKNNR